MRRIVDAVVSIVMAGSGPTLNLVAIMVVGTGCMLALRYFLG